MVMALVAASSVLLSCNNQTAGDASANQPKEIKLNRTTFDKLGAKSIYFGHMSVGNNIMEGVQDILRENPDAELDVRETESIDPAGKGLFAHSPIGDNMHPLKKIANFKTKIANNIGDHADIAFFKFCYIDIKADRDTEQVLTTYQQTMSRLKQKYPKTTFVHVTVPLTVVQTGWKVPVKKLIGKAPGGYLDNIVRNRFNQKLIGAYAGKEPVFDLARVEATRPDGSVVTFKWEGKTYLGMSGYYASDGRHLNAQGRRYAAEQLIVFLANI